MYMAMILPVSAVVLSSCLGTNYEFISHVTAGGGDAYLKVPTGWKIYSQKQIYDSSSKPPTSSQLNQIEAVSWTKLFTPEASTQSLRGIGFSGPVPVGGVYAFELTPSERDTFSISSLRTLVLTSDPLSSTPTTTANSPKYQMLSYQEFVRPGGFRGSTFTVDVTNPGGIATRLIQSAMVDAGTNWVYFIAMGCSVSCFKSNSATINTIVNSWNVKVVTK